MEKVRYKFISRTNPEDFGTEIEHYLNEGFKFHTDVIVNPDCPLFSIGMIAEPREISAETLSEELSFKENQFDKAVELIDARYLEVLEINKIQLAFVQNQPAFLFNGAAHSLSAQSLFSKMKIKPHYLTVEAIEENIIKRLAPFYS